VHIQARVFADKDCRLPVSPYFATAYVIRNIDSLKNALISEPAKTMSTGSVDVTRFCMKEIIGQPMCSLLC
jgi:hypothetical protein